MQCLCIMYIRRLRHRELSLDYTHWRDDSLVGSSRSPFVETTTVRTDHQRALVILSRRKLSITNTIRLKIVNNRAACMYVSCTSFIRHWTFHTRY